VSTDIENLLGDDPPKRGRVTTHAIFSYQSRVDPSAPYPAARLRELWEQSESTDAHPAARVADGLFLVYDVDPRGCKAVILTCYPVSWEENR